MRRAAWRLCVVAITVVALAVVPAAATEIKFKKKADDKAEQKDKEEVAKDEATATAKKKNCPLDASAELFNTIEDVYGFDGTVEALATSEQPAAAATTAATPATDKDQQVQWRPVTEDKKKTEKKKSSDD